MVQNRTETGREIRGAKRVILVTRLVLQLYLDIIKTWMWCKICEFLLKVILNICANITRNVCAKIRAYAQDYSKNLRKIWEKMRNMRDFGAKCAKSAQNCVKSAQNCVKLLEILCDFNFFRINFYCKLHHNQYEKTQKNANQYLNIRKKYKILRNII